MIDGRYVLLCLYFSCCYVSCVKLPILLLVPFYDSRSDTGWDRGLELLPAARLAVEQINNRSLLVDYELELIEESSSPCGITLPSNAVVNVAKYVLNNPRGSVRNSIAIIGLACSTVTAAVSSLSGQPEVDLLQISMANSPAFRNSQIYRRLWRVLPSSLAFVDTMFALMNQFVWSRVGLVYDEGGVYFRTTARAFADKVHNDTMKVLVSDLAIDNSDEFLDTVISHVQGQTIRIIYVAVTIPEASRLMCKAARANLIWPGYQWIFIERTADEIISNSECTEEEMIKATENILLMHFQLQNDLDSRLVSGQTYEEYYSAYQKKLQLLNSTDIRYQNAEVRGDNMYASAMYDEVWALGLAINKSLPVLKSRNLSLENYQFNQTNITDILEESMRSVSFTGTVSQISFDEKREALTPINLFLVKQGQQVHIGEFHTTNQKLTLHNISDNDFPDDDFVEVVNLPLAELIVTLCLSVLGYILTTIKALIYYCYRKTPDIKATSPVLMILIFTGTYLAFSCPIFFVARLFVQSEEVFSTLCILQRTLINIGYTMILATVLVKIARIHRVFTYFGKTGKSWKDKYLAVYVLLITLCPLLETLIIIIVDRNQYGTLTTTDIDSNPPVRVTITFCNVEYSALWDFIILAYTGVLILALVYYAIATRKISRKQFKDTKKIITYVFISAINVGILFPVFAILSALGNVNVARVILNVMCFEISFVSQLFFIDVKVFPALWHYTIKNHIGIYSFPTLQLSQRNMDFETEV